MFGVDEQHCNLTRLNVDIMVGLFMIWSFKKKGKSIIGWLDCT